MTLSAVVAPGCHPTERAETNGRWHSFQRGSLIYNAEEQGGAWRVASGSVRLDHGGAEGLAFGGLAVPGDVMGVETLLFGRYSFSARALASCTLERWPDGEHNAPSESLLQMLTRAQQRAAEVIALRCGRPLERIQRLMHLLAKPAAKGEGTRITVPRLSDMAEITSLTPETVSRAMSELRRQGGIQRMSHGMALVHLDASRWAA